MIKKIDYLTTRTEVRCDQCEATINFERKCWGCKQDLCRNCAESSFYEPDDEILFFCDSCKKVFDKEVPRIYREYEEFLLKKEKVEKEIRKKIKNVNLQ